MAARLGGRLWWPALVVTTAAALVGNLLHLTRAPLLYDESLYAAVGWRYVHWGRLSPQVQALNGNNFEHPPLAKYVFGLAQLALGEGIPASRVAGALATLLAALLLGLWVGRVAGRWTGLLAGGLTALVPMAVTPEWTRFTRTAMLDNVALPVVVLTLVVAWSWATTRRGERSRWALALALGAAVGLATSCKENAFLVVVGPVLLTLALSARRPRALAHRLGQAVAAALVAVATFVATYLPLGDPTPRIRYLVDFQTHHSAEGHIVGLAGMATQHPPWWALYWFTYAGLGLVVTVAVAAAMLAAVVLRRDRITWWLVVALAGPCLFHSFVAGVALPFYWCLWVPLALALAALGVGRLAGLATGAPGRPALLRGLAGLAAAALLVAVAAPSAATLGDVVRLPVPAMTRMAGLRAAADLHGAVVTAGTSSPALGPIVGPVPLLTAVPADVATVDTVVVGQPRCRILVDPTVRALVAANLAAGRLRLATQDRLVRIYLATAPLRAPTPAQVAAEPRGSLADHC